MLGLFAGEASHVLGWTDGMRCRRSLVGATSPASRSPVGQRSLSRCVCADFCDHGQPAAEMDGGTAGPRPTRTVSCATRWGSLPRCSVTQIPAPSPLVAQPPVPVPIPRLPSPHPHLPIPIPHPHSPIPPVSPPPPLPHPPPPIDTSFPSPTPISPSPIMPCSHLPFSGGFSLCRPS